MIDVPLAVEIEDGGASDSRGDRVGGVTVEERGRAATEMEALGIHCGDRCGRAVGEEQILVAGPYYTNWRGSHPHRRSC